MAFNLTAQLNLQGPTNVKQIAAQIKKDLGNINANVTFKLDPAVTKNVAALSSSLKGLNAAFGSTTTSATSAAAAIKAFGNSINSVKINNVPQQINAAANAVNKLNKASASSAKDLGSAAAEMQEFGKQAGLAIRRFVAFSTVTSVIYGLTNSISQGVQAFIDYDKELVKLQQVTGESSAGLAKLQEQITTLSTTFGVSSKDLTSVASTLAQAGLSARETEKALRALALSSLAPSFDDMNETVEGSIALMRQFGISADDLEGALGAVNTVAARFAVESSDIITAVQRTGSVFATASKGVSEGKDALNEFIAVFTSVRATTRESAETIATGLRTIFTRIQRGTTIDALKEFGVNLTDTEGKFVGAYKAVELLSKGLSGIDPRSLQFSKIVEELGGFRQIGKVIPLIQQFTVAQDALKTAQAGQGSLAKDAATAQLSLANQISKVRQEFFALFREIGQSKGFQSLIRGALSLASGLIKVTDAIKGILPALAIITAFKGAKALTQFASGFSSGVKRGPDGKANGGVIRKFARGGVVPGTGSGDTVPAMLEPGEFVIRKKAVQTIGADNLHSMNKYGSGGSIRAGVSSKRKKFKAGGKAEKPLIEDISYNYTYDGDSLNVDYTPTEYARTYAQTNPGSTKLYKDKNKKSSYSGSSRLIGIDTPELSGSGSRGGFTDMAKTAHNITESWAEKQSHNSMLEAFQSVNELDFYDRPMFHSSYLVKQLKTEGVAKNFSMKRGSKLPADIFLGRIKYLQKKFPNTEYKNLVDEVNDSEDISWPNARSGKKDIEFFKRYFFGGTVQKFASGGQVSRNIGIIDTDVLRDPANTSVVKKEMEKLGITDVSDYTTKLGEFAAKARKNKSLSKFIAIAGAAGSGKSSLATGKGANDNASLRKTTRSQILTPEDIDKVNEVIVLTSTASQTKLDAYLKDVDRAYVLSSNSRDEQNRVRLNRDRRDTTGEGLYGRKPGTTRAADTDFGLEETILRDELGKKATVLGRKKDSFNLRRKKENELPEIVQAGGFYMGGFAPPTRGHRGALDTLLNSMLAKNPSASLEDILVSVAPDLPMIVGKEGIDHAARYGIFPADLRTLFSQMNFGDAMISTQSQTGGGLPKFMEVTGAGDRRKFARLKGAMAITSGKDDKTLGKYQRAGIDVKDIPRIEDISATAVRDALFQGDDKTLTSLMNPDIASILMGNRAQLRNRSTMVPMLIEEIQKFVDQEKIRSNDEVSQILSNAPGGPYGNVSADLKKNYPEIADQVKKIRDKRDQVSKGAFGYRAFNIIRALSAKYPDMYGLDPSRRSSVSAKPSDVSKEIIAAQLSEQMSGEFGGIPTDMPSGLEEAILKNVEKATQVKKSSGILPAQGTEILKRFGNERLPNDPSFGPFSGKTVRDTADGGKLKYWNSAFRPETKAEKLAYYTRTRDYLIDKFNESQGTQKATALAETTNAVLSSKQLGLVGLNPLGYTGLLGPETWNLGIDPSGQERSIEASIVQRGLPNQYQNVIDYLSGQTEEIVGGASKLLGISPKKLTKKQRETLGQGNIEGALLEQIFGSADATILDDALRTRPIDFPMGIGPKAAQIFGIDPDIPTEVKRTIDSGSRSKAVEEFQRYFRQQYGIPEPKELETVQKLARGGKASRRFTFSKEPIGPSPFDTPKSSVDYFSLEQGSGFSALEFNSLARDAKTYGLNLEEFGKMLETRRSRKAALSGVKTDFSSLLGPEVKSQETIDRQKALAQQLMGEPDAGYRPIKRYAEGGEVYSPQQLVSLAKYRTGPFPGGGTDSEFINRYLEDNDSFMEYLKTFHADPPKAYDATKNAAKDMLEMFTSKESMSGSKRSGKLYSTVAGGKLKTILTQINNPLNSNKDIPDAIGKNFNLNGSLLSTSESPDTAAVFQPENGSSAMLSIFRNKNIPSIDVDKTIFDTSTEDDVIKALSKYIDPVSGKNGADYLSRSRSATRIEKEFILPPTSKFRIDDIDRIYSKDQEDKLLGGDIRHIEGMKVQQFADGGKTKLYHGSNTGVDDSVLKSFKEKGALSNIASGYGQGAGFYLYTEKNKAEQQAKMRVGGGSGFTVTSGDTSGKPMVLSFDETLDPKTYDLDYELQKNLVTQWLHDNFDKIKDKAAPDKEKGLAGIRDIIAKDASKGVMSAGIKVQSAEGSRKALYAGGDSNIREGEILGQIMNRLQSGDPELVNSFESELFKSPLGLALKYTGSNPLKPTNIETFAQGGQAGISSKDTVPALLTPGEFVINKKAAQNIGYGKLERLNKADKIQGYNKGGIVGGGVIQRFATGGSVFSIEAIMQGLKGLAEPAVQKLKTRPETIDSKSIEASSELFNNVKLLAQGFEEAGYSMISFNKVLDKVAAGADISYNDIEKAMTKDVERLKITGASIDTIIEAEKALKTVRDQSKTAIVKRQFLEAGLKESKTGKVLGSGGAQQAILTEAEKKEKLITAQRKSQIEKDLIKKDPSLLGDKDKLERRTNRRLEKEQRQIKEQAFTSATEKVTGIKRSELSGMGIGGADIQSYVSQSMTDRKTLAQMDKQLIAMKTEELTSSAKYLTASAAEQQNMLSKVTELAKEEVRTRREMINEMAAEQGEKGVGAADFMDFRNSPIKKAVQERYFSGTMSQGFGTALGDVGMVAGLVGGQGKNIANLMYDTSTDEGKIAAAGKGAAIEQAGSTLATGLTTASQLMAINPMLGAAVAIGTALYAASDAVFDFTGAQETAALEMEKNLRFEEVAASEKDLAKAFKDFEKDLGNIDLQKALDKALVRSSESSLKAVAAETKVAQNEKGKTRTWTEFLSGAEKPKMDTQDFNELDSKIAERNADSGNKAFALISQRINTGASVESIQADKELIGARRALVLADEDALKTVRSRIASEGGYDKVSKQRQDAILDEVANEKILTNVQVQSAIKTKQMSDALDAADKAGRKLAASFEKLSNIISESVNRIKFESDVRKASAEESRSALRGQSEDRGPKLRELNVLENPNAYSEKDFNQALQSATAGVDEKTRNQLIGGAQLQQQLPNAITKGIADKLSTKGSLGVDEAKAEAIKITNEKIDKTNLSDEQKTSLKEQAKTRINKLAEDAKEKNDTPQAELDAFREGLGDADNILGAFGIKTLEAVKALSSFKQGALADFSEGLRDASKAAKDAQNYFKKARDIRTQGNMNLREVMTGVGESYDEKQARIMGDVAGLAGGQTTVGGIKNRMVDLQGQRTAVEEKRQGMSDPNELKRSAEELRSLDDQLRDTREALDTLASSTELVEQAFNDLKNVRELQKNRESFVNTLLTNTPEEADKLNKTFIRLQRNLSGGLNTAGNQRDARKAFNQTLRETGSVREATKAGNTVLANQRKETLALSQDSGVRAAQELNIRNQYAQGKGKPGVSADQAVADYFKQQQLQLTKSMAIESGMMNNPLVRQSIAAMEDPNADPAMKEASSKYLQSVGLQADATKAQGELALLESQQALVSANANLKVSIDDLRTTIEANMINNDTNEGRVGVAGGKMVNPGVAVAAPVAARARGGVIYASEGQLVNFQPQGTDTVPAMLTPGEFVINARSTAEHLPLLKAINSGNYSKGGVVYLAQGGSVNPEAQKRKEERVDAQKESWMMSEATGARPDEVVSRTSSSWAQSQVGDGRWMGMTEDERQSEAKKYEPEFQNRWDNYNNRENDAQLRSANDAGYGSIKEDPNSGIVGANFFNEEKKRATERFEKARDAENEALNNPIAQTPLSPQEFSQPVIQPSLSVPLVKAEVVPWGRGTTTKIRPTQEAIDEKKKIKSEELRRRSLWLKGSKGRSPEEETEYATLKSNQIKREVGPYTVEKDRNISSLVNSAYRKGAQSNEITPEERSALKELGSDRRNRGSLRALSFSAALPPITSNGGKPGSVDPATAARINEGYSRPSNEQQAAEQNAVIESGIRQQYTANKPLQKPDPNDPKYQTRNPLKGMDQRIADNRAYEAQQTQQATQTNTSVNLRTPEIKNEDGRLGVNIGPMVPSPRVSLPGDYVAGRNYIYGSDLNTPRFESQKTIRDRESSRRDWFDFPLGSPSNVLATETMIKYPNQLFKPNSQINSYQSVGATDPYEYSNDPKIRAKAETQNVYRITASPALSSSIQTSTTSSDSKQKREADSAIASTKIGIEKRAQIAAQEQAFDVEFNQLLESGAWRDDEGNRESYKKQRREQVINERNQAKLDAQTAEIDNKFNKFLAEGKVKENQREQYRTEQRSYMPKPYMESAKNYKVPTTEQLLQDQANSEAIAQFEGTQQATAAEKVRAQQQKAEEDRQASLWINSSNPVTKTAGYVGGVTQGIGDALYGAANITAGAVATAASPIVGGIGYAMSGDDTAFQIGDENNLRNRTAENMYDEARANGRPMPSPQEIAAAQDAAVIRARVFTENSNRLNNQPGAYSAATRAAAEVGVNAMGAGAMSFVEAGQAVAGMGPIQNGTETALQRNDARNVELAGGMDSYSGFATAGFQTAGYASSQAVGALINAEGAVTNVAGRAISSGARVAGRVVPGAAGAGRVAGRVAGTVDRAITGTARGAGRLGGRIPGASGAGRAVNNFVEGVQDVATQMGDVIGVRGIAPNYSRPNLNRSGTTSSYQNLKPAKPVTFAESAPTKVRSIDDINPLEYDGNYGRLAAKAKAARSRALDEKLSNIDLTMPTPVPQVKPKITAAQYQQIQDLVNQGVPNSTATQSVLGKAKTTVSGPVIAKPKPVSVPQKPVVVTPERPPVTASQTAPATTSSTPTKPDIGPDDPDQWLGGPGSGDFYPWSRAEEAVPKVAKKPGFGSRLGTNVRAAGARVKAAAADTMASAKAKVAAAGTRLSKSVKKMTSRVRDTVDVTDPTSFRQVQENLASDLADYVTPARRDKFLSEFVEKSTPQSVSVDPKALVDAKKKVAKAIGPVKAPSGMVTSDNRMIFRDAKTKTSVVEHELAHSFQTKTAGMKADPFGGKKLQLSGLMKQIESFVDDPMGLSAITGGKGYSASQIKKAPYELLSTLMQHMNKVKGNKRAESILKQLMKFHGYNKGGLVRYYGNGGRVDDRGYTESPEYKAAERERQIQKVPKPAGGRMMYASGGLVYANNGALVPSLAQGTDTVPAMLTPGEFVINREASQQHMPLLHAINSGHFNRGGAVNYLANGGIVAPKYYAAAGLVSGGSGGSSGVSNDISSSISAAVGQAMNEAVGQLSTTLQSGMETYSQMMQSSTETLNNFGQTFSSASQTIASSANTWSETASQIPTSLTAEVTGRQVVDFTGLGKEGDRIVSSAAQAGELSGRQTSQNTMAKYDRSQFDGNLNTAANNRPMRT